jgi:hypothetical protein
VEAAPAVVTRRKSLGAGQIGVEQEEGEGPGRRRWILGHVSGVYVRRWVAWMDGWMDVCGVCGG